MNQFKIMPKKENQQITQKELEKLLNQQTLIILSALDKKTSLLDKKIDAMETRFNKKLDRLTATLDRFLKRMTDMEDEFKMMKIDINRLKRIISEKLGVEIL